MKVLNLIWGFTLGAGIDKCFLTYARLGEVDTDIEVQSVCVNLQNLNSHIEPLKKLGVTFIELKRRTDVAWIKQLKQIVEQIEPDVIFTHGFNGAIMMLIERLFMRMKIPVVCTYHGAYHAPTLKKKLLEPIYNFLSIFVYKKIAKRVICVENISREYLCSIGVPEDKVVTVHNGISDIALPVTIDHSVCLAKNIPTIVTASRITKVKGLPFLLSALKTLNDKEIKFHYIMIGEGPDLESLRKQANMLGLDDVITYAGFQDNVDEWLAACDIFVIPSLYEYHSIAILEAMRAGKAIVATTVGGNGESITDGVEGLLVPPSDPVSLAAALEQLFSSSKLRERLGQNARDRFETEFTETAMMKGLVNVLKGVFPTESE